MNTSLRQGFLTGNMLKLIGIIAMTIDHIGLILLPQYDILRILGRIVFPIFAYMIAEGCRYTKDRKKYLEGMICLAIICQAGAFVFAKSIDMCIIVTFVFSITLIYLIDYMIAKRDTKSFLIGIFAFLAIYFVCEMLPNAIKQTSFSVDYGFFGVITPVFVYLGKNKKEKIAMLTFASILLASHFGGIQWYALLAIVLIMMYNGKRGKANIKNMFYIYYPAHIAAIYLIDRIL